MSFKGGSLWAMVESPGRVVLQLALLLCPSLESAASLLSFRPTLLL